MTSSFWSRRRLALLAGLVLAVAVGIRLALPELIRRVAVARLTAITGRPVRIDGVDVALLAGHLAVRGLHVAERGGQAPFADFGRIDVRLNLPSLLRGSVWIHELVVRRSTVRVVRFEPNEFNLSDLVRSSGTTRRVLDITIDRFAVRDGTVTLEDRALPEPRTWTSKSIQLEAAGLSTRRGADGSAVGSSVIDGAPVSVEVDHLRLYPIHLESTVTIEGLDLALARLYLPPEAPVFPDRGRASTSVSIRLDARTGLRADSSGRFEDVAVARRGAGEPVARAPILRVQARDLSLEGGQFRLGRLDVAGSLAVLDPAAGSGGHFLPARLRASAADLSWPLHAPARLQLLTTVQGRGRLLVSGVLGPPTTPSQLRLRLTAFDLEPRSRLLAASARVSGIAQADLQVHARLAAGAPARVHGSIVVDHPGLANGSDVVPGAQRVEATGLRVQWPARLSASRLLVRGPWAVVERDRAGRVSVRGLPKDILRASRPRPRAATPKSARARAGSLLGFRIGQIIVRDGSLGWRDAAVTPPVELDFSSVDLAVTGARWPAPGPIRVSLSLRPPGGGRLELAGRVALDPLRAAGHLGARNADLAPYAAYVGAAARVEGRADLDL